MRICPFCQSPLAEGRLQCSACQFAPVLSNGFWAWAPELEKVYGGFPADNYAGLAAAESRNFWFRARNELILWALAKYFPRFQSLLEVGCGTGFVLSGIAARYPGARLEGCEIFTKGLSFAAERLPAATLIQADARALPYEEEFDVVAAFDVIEHIEEDEKALANLFRATKSGGGLVLSVPQHRWLWSGMDDAACHVRRYAARDLHRKIEAAGFRIRMSTSFVSFLLPAMMASRLIHGNAKKPASDHELRLPPIVNSAFEAMLSAERLCIKAGVRFPVGGSRMVVAAKG